MLVFLFLLTSLPATVRSDGLALINWQEGYLSLRENRQLAYVEVSEDAERIHLFLGIASLDPGRNITVVIPLKTRPDVLGVEMKTDAEFREEHNLTKILELSEKQNRALQRLADEIVDIFPDLTMAEFMGLVGAVASQVEMVPAGLGGGGVSKAHYEFEGASVDVLSFHSASSLMDFYRAMNMTAPENMEEIVQRYGNFSIAILNATTEPPIPWEQYSALMEAEPEVMAKFREYVETHPTISVAIYGTGAQYVNFRDHNLSGLLYDISNWTLRDYFANLVLTVYGFTDVRGVEMEMEAPLHDGRVYFPLGTSPAWSVVNRTEVVFEVPGDREIAFALGSEEVFYGGGHYYVWTFENVAPDYDLEGRVQNKTFWTSWSEFVHGVNQWVHEHSRALAVMFSLAAFILMWFAVFLVATWLNGQPITRGRLKEVFLWGALTAFLSLGLTLLVAVLYTFVLHLRVVEPEADCLVRKRWNGLPHMMRRGLVVAGVGALMGASSLSTLSLCVVLNLYEVAIVPLMVGAMLPSFWLFAVGSVAVWRAMSTAEPPLTLADNVKRNISLIAKTSLLMVPLSAVCTVAILMSVYVGESLSTMVCLGLYLFIFLVSLYISEFVRIVMGVLLPREIYLKVVGEMLRTDRSLFPREWSIKDYAGLVSAGLYSTAISVAALIIGHAVDFPPQLGVFVAFFGQFLLLCGIIGLHAEVVGRIAETVPPSSQAILARLRRGRWLTVFGFVCTLTMIPVYLMVDRWFMASIAGLGAVCVVEVLLLAPVIREVYRRGGELHTE